MRDVYSAFEWKSGKQRARITVLDFLFMGPAAWGNYRSLKKIPA
jgi:hypothetical protein